jgi:tellurite methyltransferase
MKKIVLIICIFISLFAHAREAISSSRFEMLTGEKRGGKANSFWDKKYAQDNYIYGKAPARFLSKNYDYIPQGSNVLDIGMGEGRNAVFLATKGYKVTGIDISRVAIKKARLLAKEFGVRINSIHESISKYNVPNNSVDAIICFYFLDRKLIKRMMSWLKPGGVLIFESFTMKQNTINSANVEEEYLLKEKELLRLFPGFNILKYEEAQHRKDFIASIIVEKPKK